MMPLASGFLSLLQDPVELINPVEGNVEPQHVQCPDDELTGPLLPGACLREEDGGVVGRTLPHAEMWVLTTDLE